MNSNSWKPQWISSWQVAEALCLQKDFASAAEKAIRCWEKEILCSLPCRYRSMQQTCLLHANNTMKWDLWMCTKATTCTQLKHFKEASHGQPAPLISYNGRGVFDAFVLLIWRWKQPEPLLRSHWCVVSKTWGFSGSKVVQKAMRLSLPTYVAGFL